ncbi:ribonucleotide reductase subunit alpha [Marinobacter sp. 1Y8]
MIESYTDFVNAATAQPEQQRLLFVFCKAELPEDASAAEKEQFERGNGGSLQPVTCVDKSLDEASHFEQLVDESAATGQHWDIVFIAALSGRAGSFPSSDEAQQPLTMMVESIRLGNLGNYLPFNRDGELIHMSR